MKTACFAFWFAALAASLALPQANSPAPAAKKTPGPQAKSKTAATAKKSKSSGKSSKKGAPAVTWRNRQTVPTPERYREIQQALAAKGYLKGEPTGVWDAESAEALRQFQTDRNLTPTGKINAPSLIGLGLGPAIPDAPPIIPAPAPEALPAAPSVTPPPQ